MSKKLPPQAHLVVVDARPKDYRRLSHLAGENRWHVHLLTSGAAAMQFARRCPADLWLVNSRLPDVCGLELLAMIRRLWRGATVLVVADRYDAREECRACQGGAGSYLGKDADHQLDCGPLLSTFAVPLRDAPIRAAPSRSVG